MLSRIQRNYFNSKGKPGPQIFSIRLRLVGLCIQFLKRNSARIALSILIIQLLYIFVKLNLMTASPRPVVAKSSDNQEYMYNVVYEDRGQRGGQRVLDAHGDAGQEAGGGGRGRPGETGLGRRRPDFVVNYEDDYDHLEEEVVVKAEADKSDDGPEPPAKEHPQPELVLAPLRVQPAPVKEVPMTPKPEKPQMRLCTMQERIFHLRSYCNSTDVGDKRPDMYRKARYGGLIVDEKHKLVFCDVSQMASVLWSTILAKATGSVTAEKPPVRNKKYMNNIGLKYLDTYTNEERDKILADYYKFLIVQHPFDRLVSQWKLRFIEASSNDPWRKKLGRQIILHKRRVNNKTLSSVDLPEDATARLEEVVEYAFVDRNMIDPTWFTYVQVCHPCELDYNAILRVETLKQDANVILSRLKDYYQGIPDEIIVTSELDVLHGRTNIKSFQNVTKIGQDMLLKKYQHDISMFGYTWDLAHRNATCTVKTTKGDVCC